MSELMGNIQPDVSPENVCALFGAELNKCGSRA
jgi:hypothetical protein